jgi:deoxycytidylate deaminase
VITKAAGWTWSELAFASKDPINELDATFISAPRELSPARLTELVKKHLQVGNVVLGVAEEDFVLGFEGQPQFKTLRPEQVRPLVDKIQYSDLPRKLYTLTYAQRDWKFVLEKLKFKKVVLVYGSWKQTFHTLPAFYVLAKKRLGYEMVSPFVSTEEAREFDRLTKLSVVPTAGLYSSGEMLALAQQAASHSYETAFQTGVALGKKQADKYTLLATSFNRVVPYQTYAMHHGLSRDVNYSPMHDLNHYDTVHAEVELIVKAQKQTIDLSGTTLFINLLPCPACARMFTETDIQEFVYREDHSDGYAVKMLEAAGKTVTRLVA